MMRLKAKDNYNCGAALDLQQNVVSRNIVCRYYVFDIGTFVLQMIIWQLRGIFTDSLNANEIFFSPTTKLISFL